MNKLLVILGPTATGKTDIALSLSEKFNGEIVACDSRQVYKGLDIGSGKMPSQTQNNKLIKKVRHWEIGGIKIWMMDVVDPDVRYTVSDYIKDANKIIDQISKKGKLPIITAGTGLYLKALLFGLDNLNIPVDQNLRGELEKLSLGQLQQRLKKLSPGRFKQLNQSDRQNKRRLLRSIELISMYPYKDIKQNSEGLSSQYDLLKIGLTAQRPIINKKIDLRAFRRLNDGMIEEVEQLMKRGLNYERLKELGLEYGIITDYLTGSIPTEEELVKILQNKIHQYAKRQITWFKKEKEVVWFDITSKDYPNNLEILVQEWYDKSIN